MHIVASRWMNINITHDALNHAHKIWGSNVDFTWTTAKPQHSSMSTFWSLHLLPKSFIKNSGSYCYSSLVTYELSKFWLYQVCSSQKQPGSFNMHSFLLSSISYLYAGCMNVHASQNTIRYDDIFKLNQTFNQQQKSIFSLMWQ
jgi:hypothetical protein